MSGGSDAWVVAGDSRPADYQRRAWSTTKANAAAELARSIAARIAYHLRFDFIPVPLQ
jgi:hypothetical protein